VGMRRVDTAGEFSCGRWISVLVWSHGGREPSSPPLSSRHKWGRSILARCRNVFAFHVTLASVLGHPAPSSLPLCPLSRP
jgi:hypothetical protein